MMPIVEPLATETKAISGAEPVHGAREAISPQLVESELLGPCDGQPAGLGSLTTEVR